VAYQRENGQRIANTSQSLLENSQTVPCKVHNSLRTAHNEGPDTVMFHKTIKEASVIDVAVHRSQPLQHHHREASEIYRP